MGAVSHRIIMMNRGRGMVAIPLKRGCVDRSGPPKLLAVERMHRLPKSEHMNHLAKIALKDLRIFYSIASEALPMTKPIKKNRLHNSVKRVCNWGFGLTL